MLFSQVCPYHSLDYMNHSKDLTAHIPGQNSLRVMFRFTGNPHQGHADPFQLLSRSFNHGTHKYYPNLLFLVVQPQKTTHQFMCFHFLQGKSVEARYPFAAVCLCGQTPKGVPKNASGNHQTPKKKAAGVKERWLKRMETESTPRTFPPLRRKNLGAYPLWGPKKQNPPKPLSKPPLKPLPPPKKKHAARALRVEIRLRGLTAVELQALADALPEHVQRRVRLHDLVPQDFRSRDMFLWIWGGP